MGGERRRGLRASCAHARHARVVRGAPSVCLPLRPCRRWRRRRRSPAAPYPFPSPLLTFYTYSLISVIIPTYNRAPFVLHALDAILTGQTYKNVEVVVVDDSETCISVHTMEQGYERPIYLRFRIQNF